MNFVTKPFACIILIVLLFTACISSTTTQRTDTITTVTTHITRVGTLPSADWHVYKFPKEKICIPSAWVYHDLDDILLQASVDEKDTDAFFVVVKKFKKDEGSFAYLKRSYAYLKSGNEGNLVTSSIINTVYEDKDVYNCEFHLDKGKKKSVLYATLFEKNQYTYAITLKVPDGKNSYRQTYNNILYNFYYGDKLVFSEKDKITTARVVDLAAL